MTRFLPLRREPLYHLTPRYLQAKITMEGLRTRHDRRKQGRVWLAAGYGIDKLALHLCKSHGQQHMDFACFQVAWQQVVEGVLRTSVEGRYYVLVDIPPSCLVYQTSLAVSLPDKKVWQIC